jgi:hypothetical protein
VMRMLCGLMFVLCTLSTESIGAQGSKKYPIVLDHIQLGALGFERGDALPTNGRQHPRVFSKRCPDDFDINLKPSRLRVYESKGLTLKHVCTALGLEAYDDGRGGLIYHPETGAHLITYVLPNSPDVSEATLEVPSCFGRRPVREGRYSFVTSSGTYTHTSWAIDLHGCNLRYAPDTGRRLSTKERVALMRRGLVANLVRDKGPSGPPPPPNPTHVRNTSSTARDLNNSK